MEKLTEEMILEIKNALAAGRSDEDIMGIMEVTQEDVDSCK